MTIATTSPAGQAVHQRHVEETRALPTFTIHAQLDDFPIDIAVTGTVEQLGAMVKRLRQLGALPPPRPVAGGFGGQRLGRARAQPRYNDAGDPCCSVHTNRNGQPTPLRQVPAKDGRPAFWGCPAKSDGTPGETVNARGYCDLRFEVKE